MSSRPRGPAACACVASAEKTTALPSTAARYIARFFPGHELKEDEDIFSLGFINSMFAMQLVEFLEHEFGVTIENEELELDNFRTITALCRLLERKRAVG